MTIPPSFPPAAAARVTTRSHRTAAAVAVLAASTALVPNDAAAQRIGYTLAPSGATVQWTDGLGLDNTSMYGGLFSFDFDRYASLQAYYQTNSGVQTAIDRLNLSGSVANLLGNQELGVRSYGANVVFRMGTRGLSPFVKGGGGILEFRPDAGGKSRQVSLNVGGGVRIGEGAPVFLDLFAEDLLFRVDRYALFSPVAVPGTVIPVDPEANEIRHNLLVGAAIGIPIGPARTAEYYEEEADRLQWGLRGASFAIEPMAGRLTFDNDLGIADQDLVGARAGIDLGRLVGIRGFYWRGTENDFRRVAPIQSWGGEAQFRLNDGSGITPFVLAGGAQLDFKSGFTGATAASDKTSLILGGGLAIPVAERLALNLAARDYIFGQGSGADSVSAPSDLTHNWMFSAGLRFSLGGRSGASAAEAAVLRRQRAEARADTLRRENARLRGEDEDEEAPSTTAATRRRQQGAQEGDSVDGSDRRDDRARRDDARNRTRDTVYLTQDGERVDGAARNYTTDRIVNVPVPANGELYVRYGPLDERARNDGRRPALGERLARVGDSRDSLGRARTVDDREDGDLRQVIREAVREEMRATRPGTSADSTPRDSAARTLRPLQDGSAPADSSAREAALIDALSARVNAALASRFATMQDSVRLIVRDEVRQTLEREGGVRPSDAALTLRIDSIVATRVNDRLTRVPPESPTTVTVVPPAGATTPQVQRPIDTSPRQFTTYSGLTVSGGTQLLIGGRFDAGALNWRSPGVRFVPEVAFGFGSGGQSTMIVGNALYRFGEFRFGRLPALTPHVMGGLGLLNFSDRVQRRDGLEGVVNLAYGVSFPLTARTIAGRQPVVTVEHQGVDFFGLDRLLVGLQWRY